MFEQWSAGDRIEVRCVDGVPVRVRIGQRGRDVVRVDAVWRDWQPGRHDLECWRVTTDPPLIAVIGHHLGTHRWEVLSVWD